MILVILAAGLGSRYGGLKQIDAISNNNEAIMDFSIYDAIKHGFKKVVFVVRKEILDVLKTSYTEKLKNKIEILFICQEITDIPLEFINKNRIKPWGTAHALLSTKNIVDDNFCVINADDFYGNQAFDRMANFLQQTVAGSTNYAMIGYQIENTLSKNGTVSRGECTLDSENFLKEVIERTSIASINNRIQYQLDNTTRELKKDSIVSMNFWGFTPTIFNKIETQFYEFLKENYQTEKKEFYLPTMVNNLLKNNNASVKVLRTTSKWMGVTYKKDKESVMSTIAEYKKEGTYPNSLWN